MSSWPPSLPLLPLPPLPEWARLQAAGLDNGRTSPFLAAGTETSRSRARSRARSSSVCHDVPWRPVGSGAAERAEYDVSVSDDANVTDDDDDIVEDSSPDDVGRSNTRKPEAKAGSRSRSPSRSRQAARSSKSSSATCVSTTETTDAGIMHSPLYGCPNTFAADQLGQSSALQS